MQTVVFDGTFEGWLCAVFDVYEYKLKEVDLVTSTEGKASLFGDAHTVVMAPAHSERVWKGLESRLSAAAQKQVYRTFLSEHAANLLLRYVQYVFSTKRSVENDYSHPDVLEVVQTARKVYREKHRMEAFVRFEKTGDSLYYSLVEPDFDVLPLIGKHFTSRYADQRWLIYDSRRKYGIYYDGEKTDYVQMNFSEASPVGTEQFYDEKEELYQQLWQRYFQSVNISARKNTKLHLQHMPRRYWKHLTEKKIK